MPAEAASSFYSDALTWPPCLLTGYGAPIFVPEGFYLYLVDWQRHKELEESHSRKEAFRVLAVAASVSLVRLHALAKLTEWAVGLALSSRDALTLSQRWIAWWFRYFKKGAASWRDREFIGPKDMHDSVHRSTTRKKIVPRTMHEFTESDPPPPRLVDRNRMLWVRKFKCQVPAEGVHRVSAVQQKLVWIYCIARADGAGRDWWVSEAAYNNLSEHQIEPQVSNSPASGSPPAAARPVRLTRQERIAEDEARRNERFEALAVAHAAENETLKLEMATIREEMADLKRQNAALQAEVTSLKRHRRNPEEKAGR